MMAEMFYQQWKMRYGRITWRRTIDNRGSGLGVLTAGGDAAAAVAAGSTIVSVSFCDSARKWEGGEKRHGKGGSI